MSSRYDEFPSVWRKNVLQTRSQWRGIGYSFREKEVMRNVRMLLTYDEHAQSDKVDASLNILRCHRCCLYDAGLLSEANCEAAGEGLRRCGVTLAD